MINPKRRLYAQLARIAKALASAQRLELIELLGQGERTVDALAGLMDLPIANTSHHLQVLRQASLVIGRKDGLFVHYRLADDGVFDLYRLLGRVGRERLSEMDAIIQRYLEGRDGLEPVDRRELARRVREGTVVVLDVRPAEEYAAGHIRGAMSLPIESLDAGLDRLPRDKPVVAYCRGPYCVMAFEAVRRLRRHGRDARRLEEGFPEWRAAGLPVAVGAATISNDARRGGPPARRASRTRTGRRPPAQRAHNRRNPEKPR